MEPQNTSILNISIKNDVEPLDLQYGVKEKLRAPRKLEDYFSRKDINSYVLIDAASVEQFHSLLELTESKHEILLGSNVQEEFKSVATYLFDLAQSKEFLTWLFTYSEGTNLAQCLAERKVGVFLQSSCELAELAYFFKKFIRLRDEKDQWRYFRFADPKFFSFMIEDMVDAPEYCSRWFCSNAKQVIDNYAIYEYEAKLFKIYKAMNELDDYQSKQKPLMFDGFYQALADRYSDKLFAEKVTSIIYSDFSEYYQNDGVGLNDLVANINRQSRQLGLKSEQARGNFIAASVLVGRTLGQEDLASVGFYATAMEHENRKTKKLLEQVINNIKRRSLDNGD